MTFEVIKRWDWVVICSISEPLEEENLGGNQVDLKYVRMCQNKSMTMLTIQ